MDGKVDRVAQCLYERDRRSHQELHDRIQRSIAGKGKLLEAAWMDDDNHSLLMPDWKTTIEEYRKGWYDEAKAVISTMEEMTATYLFNIGAAVMLKSGGPAMTVIRCWRDDIELGGMSVRAAWFAEDGRPRTHDFPMEALKLVTE